jgi:Family of unknown function (DUF6069)
MTSTTPSQTTTTVDAARQGRSLVVPGLAGAVTAAAGAMLVGALAGAAGVDFELPDGGESVPILGIGNLAFVFSLVGLVIAAALRRWTTRPAPTFLHIAVVLTAVSLIPPFLVGANLATSVGLVLTHLATAAIMIPVLISRLPD